ncbi:hypothetical protein CNYM01_01824 [Colletotrichum nymphaeae SA-01]|uniref:Uncharacterized protein n=1 Tax=Colletotrichum nymphaeae SA-01 TaxID=1460502 RepID=A0A135RQI2_9PEZI|nr:hypothetical protein CNYM01_01824 [Colletotrichum nymphaeae SA-01]
MEPAVERVEIPVKVATLVTAAVSGDTVACLPITAAPAASHPLEPALLPQAEGLPPLPQQRNLHPLASRQVQTTLVVALMAIHALPDCVARRMDTATPATTSVALGVRPPSHRERVRPALAQLAVVR